jgi:hypothetical protein
MARVPEDGSLGDADDDELELPLDFNCPIRQEVRSLPRCTRSAPRGGSGGHNWSCIRRGVDLAPSPGEQVMQDPVVAADGQSYERAAIAEWFRRGHRTSPVTNQRLPSLTLTPNARLKAVIADFVAKLPRRRLERQLRRDRELAIAMSFEETETPRPPAQHADAAAAEEGAEDRADEARSAGDSSAASSQRRMPPSKRARRGSPAGLCSSPADEVRRGRFALPDCANVPTARSACWAGHTGDVAGA